MDINDILTNLGLDLTNPEVKRGALEAIDAIMQSRQPTMSLDDIGMGSMSSDEIDIELDPDLIQPSQKQQQQSGGSDDIEIEDEENILDQIKHNDAEDNQDDNVNGDENSSDKQSANQADTSEEDSNETDETESGTEGSSNSDDRNKETDDFEDDEELGDGAQHGDEENDFDEDETAGKTSESEFEDDVEDDDEADQNSLENNSEAQNDQDGEESDEAFDEEDLEETDFDEDDILDDELKDIYNDEAITTKQKSRKIKRERTLSAAKKALADAQSRRVAPALLRELEKAIAALEELTEAVKKSINDISDEEFNMLVNRVFDAIDAVGDSSLTFTSEEERELQAKEIKTDLSSNKTQTELSAEDVAQIRAETQAVKAREKETAKYHRRARSSFRGFQDFLTSLYRAIALQVATEESNDDSWSAINRRYGGTGILQPGKRLNELPNKKIPIIDFYFDQSGSWTESDIKTGEKAIRELADMEANGQIKVNVYYFANNVHTDAASARREGGTQAWNEIVKNVIATQATNVVIMTDDDMEDRWNGVWRGEKALTYTVPGYVWYLWRDGDNAPRLPRDLKGRGGVQQFSFTRSDI